MFPSASRALYLRLRSRPSRVPSGSFSFWSSLPLPPQPTPTHSRNLVDLLQDDVAPNINSHLPLHRAENIDSFPASNELSHQKLEPASFSTFQWDTSPNGSVHTLSSYTDQVQKLCDARMFAAVWQIMEDMRAQAFDIPPSIFEIIIQGYCNAGQVKPAIDAFDKMAKFGCSPTIEMYSCLIAYVVRVKRHHVSMRLYKRMISEGLSANVMVFGALIHGYCHVGDVLEAYKLLEQMKKEGLAPDDMVYNCLIENLSKAKRYYTAQNLIIEMREHGLTPSLLSYNSLLDVLCKERRIVSAYRLFQDMKQAGVKPNIDTYNLIIDGFFRMNGVNRAVKLYKHMSKAGCPPDSQTDKVLLSGFTRTRKVNRALTFLDSLVAAGRKVDVVGCNTILHDLCSKNMMKAEEFLNRISNGICVPDVISYTTMMHGYCKTGRLDEAERMFLLMKSKGCKPTSVSYEALICAYCRIQRLQAASELFQELMHEGCHMNVTTCNALLDGLSRVGLVDQSFKLIEYVVEKRLILDPDKIVTFMRALGKQGRGTEGKNVLKEMSRKGCLKEPYASMF